MTTASTSTPTPAPAPNDVRIPELRAVGRVRRDGPRRWIEIDEAYRPALLALDGFSHVNVLWWANWVEGDEYRSYLQGNPPYAPEHATGVFASRSPLRPNPIGLTVCPIVRVDVEAGIVEVADIDALDDSPVLDLKAYFPVCDRVREARIPEWLVGWPEWMPDAGSGLMDGEG